MREKGSVLQFFSELHVYTQMQIDKLKKQTYFYKSLATVKASLGGGKKKKRKPQTDPDASINARVCAKQIKTAWKCVQMGECGL